MPSKWIIRAAIPAACLMALICTGTATATPQRGSGGGHSPRMIAHAVKKANKRGMAWRSAVVDTWCDDGASWHWSGLGAKTIYWTGTSDCYGESLVGLTLSTTLYAADGGFFEARGNNCTDIDYCKSSGSYSDIFNTLAGTEHILTMRAKHTLLRSGWTWKTARANCSGVGTPVLTCNYRWTFTLSVP